MSDPKSVSRSYLVEDLPYGFCPGCSHGPVVDAIGAALQGLGPEATDVVVVSDIGCVGLVDKHFKVNTFHGLHGRSITYATGLKLARPKLQVLTVIGDGGCGIGGHHMIQAARRGIDMTVIVFNNFNYGMTGGEHSSTTPLGSLTSTTPGGNTELPLDLCQLAIAAGATFVARASAFDAELPGLLARASRHPGFAIIDVWELCTAYYMPRNDFKKRQLLELAETLGMPFGVLREVERERAASSQPPAPEPVGLSRDFAAELARPLGLLVAGSAGQKIQSAASAAGRAAIRSGLYATQKDDYPITVKTGHSLSELMLSPEPILFTGIEIPDIAIVLTGDGLARSRRRLEAMDPTALILIDASLEPPPVQARVVKIDVGAVAREVGRENVSLWTVARALAESRAVPTAALKDTVERLTPERYRKKAARAVELGAAHSSGTG